ncbi:acetoacetate decarboxylase family protein [Bacillus sp. PK3_68]|uniref:acetoacetate decarboxylase family protein n=1 Tax=Bacillus sp. PK3_68 TaxID=2027408 RepID=UPI000E73A258|nr:acetoacetate decarboxylase family protein [Bacillus sp. PK3_68]RJS50149.1 acetoacetate decarboxylase [Bacillus sp. PK3_68]
MTKSVPYLGMPRNKWAIPPTPQLIRDAWMLIIGYKADPDALREVLPPGLEPHPNGLVQMNMYDVPDPDQTSGFGSFSLTYLTIEVADHDSLAANGAISIPGRYFAHYWNSSNLMRTYTREFMGVPALPGSCLRERNGNELISTLTIDGQPVIKTTVSIGDEIVETMGGHLNYYAHRQFPLPQGGGAALSELNEFPLPFTAEIYEVDVKEIKFQFPDGEPATSLQPLQPLETPSVMYGKFSFTYSMGRTIRNYLEEKD